MATYETAPVPLGSAPQESTRLQEQQRGSDNHMFQTGSPSGPDTQQLLTRERQRREILQRIKTWAGGETAAIAWFRGEPIPAFGGRTAESLVHEGKAAAVLTYLDNVEAGGFA